MANCWDCGGEQKLQECIATVLGHEVLQGLGTCMALLLDPPFLVCVVCGRVSEKIWVGCEDDSLADALFANAKLEDAISPGGGDAVEIR